MRFIPFLAVFVACLSLPVSAKASDGTDAHSAAPTDTPTNAPADVEQEPVWVFEDSDVPVDPGFVFGQLDNGMRYVLRENATPEGTALVRMRIDSGSLDETESELGLSHFLEHMAFNGSNGIPEGEMIKLLEREGLAFGADTNASTGFSAITYMLNLPRNDETLLDTALMLMRETASELTIAEDAVERERGVILAERRDRRNYSQSAMEDSFAFNTPDARYTRRLPIGTLEVLENATGAQMRALYERTYAPANTVLVIVGDFPVETMEAALRARFDDWTGGAAPVDPETGPVDITRSGLTDIYIDPALSENVSIFRLSPWQDRPDTDANRREAALRAVAYAIINRRLARIGRSEDAPFRGARFSTGDVFKDARATTLSVSSLDGEWRKGVLAATQAVNQALSFGFTQSEIDEQLANRKTALENAVEGEATRSNGSLVGGALSLLAADRIPTQARYRLDQYESMKADFTPENLLAVLQADAAPLNDPLIRFQGRTAPEGGEESGEDALRAAFEEGMALPIAAPQDSGATQFAYTDFGEAGQVVADSRDERLGLRYLTFANGVRLTLKQTDIQEDRISYRVAIDGGRLLNSREDPLATNLVTSLPAGGLGEHSQDELLSILAGRSVGLRIGSGEDSFTLSGGTTPRDLELQLQLVTAGITDPGYRREGLEQYRRRIDNFFNSLRSTPGGAYSAASGAILSDNDPRFSLLEREKYFALDFAKLKAVIETRFQQGAIEVALVGDLDEDAAIAMVAATLGALPPREADFLPRDDARQRSFTDSRGEQILRHKGEADQALVRMVWPTDDNSDPHKVTLMRLLVGIVRLELQQRLREELGQAYSPRAGSQMSRYYPGYGTFMISTSVEADEIEATRAAIATLLDDLRTKPIEADTIDRVRRPLIENYENTLKTLGGWMNLAARAQSQPDRLERYFAYPDRLNAITPEQLQAAAQQYLAPHDALEFLVLPELAQDQAE
ncbi:MAG: insulinase family protein [Erythrobacter sp.]